MSVILRCKFTPLGFETDPHNPTNIEFFLKCKFTPLGFETTTYRNEYVFILRCKFTPLGFETGVAAF